MDRDSSYTPSSNSTVLGALHTSPQIDDSNADSAVTSPTLVSCSESGATTPDSCSSTQTPLNGCDLSPADVMLDEVNQKLYDDSPSLTDINSLDSTLPPELADLIDDDWNEKGLWTPDTNTAVKPGTNSQPPPKAAAARWPPNQKYSAVSPESNSQRSASKSGQSLQKKK